MEARGLALKGLRLGLKRKCPQESVGRRVRRSREAWGNLSTGLTYSTQVDYSPVGTQSRSFRSPMYSSDSGNPVVVFNVTCLISKKIVWAALL